MRFIRPVKTPRGVLITSLCIRGLCFVGNLCFLWATVTFSFIYRVFLFVSAQLLQPTIISFFFSNAAVFLIIKQQNSAESAHVSSLLRLAGIGRALGSNACAWQPFLRLHPDVAWPARSTSRQTTPSDVLVAIILPSVRAQLGTCSCERETLTEGRTLPTCPPLARK